MDKASLPRPGEQKTLLKGWMLAKVGSMAGYKKRFCRLVHEMEAAPSMLLSRKTLYMLGKEDDALDSRKAQPLWTVTNIVEERKTSGKTKLTLKTPDQPLHIIAEEYSNEWLLLLREHSGPSPQHALPAASAVSKAPVELDAATQKRVSLNQSKLPGGNPTVTDWMEVCDFTLSSDLEPEDEEDEDAARRFELLFVALYPSRVLAYFTDETMRQPLGVLMLSKKPAAELLQDPPYNYEHAFAVPAGAILKHTWWLCPDTEADTKKWMRKINDDGHSRETREVSSAERDTHRTRHHSRDHGAHGRH